MNTEYGHGGMWYLHGPFDPDADFTLGYQQQYSPRDFQRGLIPGVEGVAEVSKDLDSSLFQIESIDPSYWSPAAYGLTWTVRDDTETVLSQGTRPFVSSLVSPGDWYVCR